MQLSFEGKVALVTGAGRGIGRSIATVLATGGAHVICVSKSAESCGSAAEEIVAAGHKAEALAVDVSNEAAVVDAAKQVLEKHTTVDILVNNAGITRDGLILRMKTEDWTSVLETNLYSCYYWIKNLAHPMARKRWGRIVNIASVVGLMGNAGQANYSAAKAGMIGLTKSMAKELSSRSVTVNAVAPGFIETDMTADMDDRQKEAMFKHIPLKRLGSAHEVACTTGFLCSQEAGYITGQVFTVDGGLVM